MFKDMKFEHVVVCEKVPTSSTLSTSVKVNFPFNNNYVHITQLLYMLGS